MQEQEFPCEMSGKQQEGDGARPGGSLSPLCLDNCRGKGSWKENGGNSTAFKDKMTTQAGLSLLLASHRCVKLH